MKLMMCGAVPVLGHAHERLRPGVVALGIEVVLRAVGVERCCARSTPRADATTSTCVYWFTPRVKSSISSRAKFSFGVALRVRVVVEVDQHRGLQRHLLHEVAKRPRAARAGTASSAGTSVSMSATLSFCGREVPVPEEGELLLQRTACSWPCGRATTAAACTPFPSRRRCRRSGNRAAGRRARPRSRGAGRPFARRSCAARLAIWLAVPPNPARRSRCAISAGCGTHPPLTRSPAETGHRRNRGPILTHASNLLAANFKAQSGDARASRDAGHAVDARRRRASTGARVHRRARRRCRTSRASAIRSRRPAASRSRERSRWRTRSSTRSRKTFPTRSAGR